MPTCPDGHATDARRLLHGVRFSGGATVDATDAGAVKSCPACGASISGRFCESCGQDSAIPGPSPTQTAQPPAAVSVEWTAVVTADREYYKRVIARGGPDTVEFPEVFPERRIRLQDSTLIGRNNRKQGVEPGIDLGIHPVDRGVSTQHAVPADPGFGPDDHRPRVHQRHQPQRQRRPARQRDETALVRRRPHPRRRLDHDHGQQVREETDMTDRDRELHDARDSWPRAGRSSPRSAVTPPTPAPSSTPCCVRRAAVRGGGVPAVHSRRRRLPPVPGLRRDTPRTTAPT